MKRLLALALALFATCHGSQADEKKLVFGVTAAQDYLAGYVADAKGLFKKNGIDVEMKFMSNGAAIPPALLADSLQFGAIPLPVVMQAAAAGFPMKIVAPGALVTEAAPAASVVGRSGQGIKDAKDFEGKKVAITALNGFFAVLFNQWLRDRGADPKKVTFIEARGPQHRDLLKSGQVDAVVAPQAFVWGLTNDKTGYLIAPYSGQFKQQVLGSAFVVTKDWADRNPIKVQAFRSAIDEAVEFIQKNPRESKEILASALRLPKEVIDSLAIGGYFKELNSSNIEMWNSILRTEGLIEKPVNPESLMLPRK